MPHVVIIGAGCVGLLLAQGLKRQGIPFTIFEAKESATQARNERDWGMSIQWGLSLLGSLLPPDLLDRLQEVSVDPHYVVPEEGNVMPVYNVETGERIKSVPLVQMLRVSRRKFRALLAEGLDIQYNHRLTDITEQDNGHIQATFSNGQKAIGTLIIGADGANSTLRTLAFSSSPTASAIRLPYGGINTTIQYPTSSIAKHIRSHLSPLMAIGVHPRGYWLWLSIQSVPDPKDPSTWTFQLQWTWPLSNPTLAMNEPNLKTLKAEAAAITFAEPFKTAWTAIPDDSPIPINRISAWEPIPIPNEAWNGKIALVGDAAHAMSFHRGQGLNHGIADALKLVEALVEVELGVMTHKEAVLEYEKVMIYRAGQEVKISKLNTEMMHDWAKFMASPFMERGGDKNED
ncbi:hypothetical protein CKM354_000221300 [Cercospora kikuchii]|uniref:FAD-binding domain-containing protein n=1 Tax=Cercospora kikuchii TaxID=84275 RepID=A0A9P3CCE6_9PEZI|nr:uncharacterized protein CKM354_000221300 [Cercospora kikuchii]GIZ38812.1 hypothetical protein CKM354_000221300 [Cercospora kikuchii]